MRRLLLYLQRVPLYVFVILFFASGLISVYALRQNNLSMLKLRDAVYEADKNDGDVNKALNDLRQYVFTHMNTDLSSGGNSIKPPIQLKYTYERLTAKAQKVVNDESLYTEAANYCQERIPASVSVSGRSRVACVQEYILSHGGRQAERVPSVLYQFDFVGPSWSPDFAGWSLVLTVFFFLVLVFRIATKKVSIRAT